MSKITSNIFNRTNREFMINNYKDRQNVLRSQVNMSSGDIIGHRNFKSAKHPNYERNKIYSARRAKNSGDIVSHRDNKTRKSEFENRRKRLREARGMHSGKTSGDFIQHRDTRSILTSRRPRSARKSRPTYKKAYFNGDIVGHHDDKRFRTKEVYGRRPKSARKSRFTTHSGDIIGHSDNRRYSVTYKIGRRMVDSPKIKLKGGGKKMGYSGMDANLLGTVPRKGFKKFKKSSRKNKPRPDPNRNFRF